jgi:hypothetical protein
LRVNPRRYLARLVSHHALLGFPWEELPKRIAAEASRWGWQVGRR